MLDLCATGHFQESVREMMTSNGSQIALGLVAAACYCSAFHHLKDFVKRRTEKHRSCGHSTSACSPRVPLAWLLY